MKLYVLVSLCAVSISKGAPGIRTENALLWAYIYVDIRERDIGSYVREAKKAVAEQVTFPSGYYVTWSGQFENMERVIEKMKVAVAIGFVALAGAAETGVVMLIYLDQAWEAIKRKCRSAGREPGAAELYAAVMEGAVERGL